MAESIDVVRLGERLRRVRLQRALTLRQVADATKLSVPTLSRIERAGSNDLEGGTLLALSEWLDAPVEELMDKTPPKTPGGTGARDTPEIVELYLRADKKLDKKTASALARMFRTAYETLVARSEKR